MKNILSDSEKQILEDIACKLSVLSKPQQIHISGFIEGIITAREIEKAENKPA